MKRKGTIFKRMHPVYSRYAMSVPPYIILTMLAISHCLSSAGQFKKNRLKAAPADSVVVPADQQGLFIAPKRNLLTTHVDLILGASEVVKADNSGLGFAGTVKGLYSFTGALYVNFGMGIASLHSRSRVDSSPITGRHSATLVMLPLGVGFTIGDDRAQIINGVDFFPVYYIDIPSVERQRRFSYGFGIDLGFHIRIRNRIHLGMIGKLQLFEPFDRNEHQSFPRYGLAGGGLLLRYD